MNTLFLTEKFFSVIEDYNQWIFPFQIIILIFGFLCLGLLFLEKSYKNKIIGSFLGFLWIWTGLFFQIAMFTTISIIAYAFGGLFILQGLFIIVETINDDKLVFNIKTRTRYILGYILLVYGLIIYPLMSFIIEGSVSNIESLGVPCPTTIFTFGFFMLTSVKFPRYLLIIPAIWALIGLATAINFKIYEDFIIVLVAFLAVMAKGKSRVLPGPF